MRSLKAAIIGAGGQIGSQLLASLAGDPRIDVFGVCRNGVSAGPLRLEGHDVRCADVSDLAAATALLADRDVIVNCAATGGTPAQKSAAERRMLRTLCGLPGGKRLIHFSSVAVYGSCIDARRSRFERPRPDQPYGRHKLDLERYLARCLRGSAHEAVVLRLGHVYGAGQWLSRFVLAAAADPGFHLPFDGRLPSNAVHVRNVGAAVRRLVADWPAHGVYNLADAPGTTWRQVFDWNTTAVGAARVPGMSEEASARVAAHHRRRAAAPLVARLTAEIGAWLRTLPGSFIAACPATKELGALTLAALRHEGLERRLLKRYKVMAARAAAPAPAAGGESWLSSQGAPGPALSYPGAVGIEDARALATWHARCVDPDALLHWDALAADRRDLVHARSA